MSKSLSLSPPYSSLIPRTRDVAPPTTYDDLASPTIALIGGGDGNGLAYALATGGGPTGALVSGGGACITPSITTRSL